MTSNLRVVRRVLVLWWCLAGCLAGQAQADVRAQNLAADRYVKAMETRMRCPAHVEQKVQRAWDTNDLPPHLQLSGTARQQLMLATFTESFRQLPREMQQMALAAPSGTLAMQAQQMGVTVEQLRRAMAGEAASVQKRSAFMASRSAEISIASELGPSCDAQCLTNIRWSLIVAISGWKLLCSNCSDDFLSVVSIDGRVWLDPRVSRWIREAPVVAPARYPFKGDNSTLHAALMPPGGAAAAAPGSRNQPPPLVLMEHVQPDDAGVRRVCSAPRPAAGETDVLQRVQAAICGGDRGVPPTPGARMQLKLMSGPTSCGPSTHFLGCGKPDNSVELTFDQTRYSFVNVFGAQDAVVGQGNEPPLSGMVVLMHEVGHWFGLPHLNYRLDEIPDMMQDTYLENACVSGLNLVMMSGMSDESHAQRFRIGGGYKRAASTKGSRAP